MSTYRTADGGLFDPAGMPEYDQMGYQSDVKALLRPMGWSHPEGTGKVNSWDGADTASISKEWAYVQVDVDGAPCRVPLHLLNLLRWLAYCGEDAGVSCGGHE